jgi:hypothetical protein
MTVKMGKIRGYRGRAVTLLWGKAHRQSSVLASRSRKAFTVRHRSFGQFETALPVPNALNPSVTSPPRRCHRPVPDGWG